MKQLQAVAQKPQVRQALLPSLGSAQRACELQQRVVQVLTAAVATRRLDADETLDYLEAKAPRSR